MIKNAINDFILGMKLIRYGFRPKMNLGLCLFFIIIGVVVEIGSKGTEFLGIFYMLLSGLYAFQMIISMDISTFVQTSKMKRALQTSVPIITGAMVSFIVYTFIVIERLILASIYPEESVAIINSLFMAILLVGITLIYEGICYKFFGLATGLMIVAVFGVIGFCNIVLGDTAVPISTGAIVAIGYGVIVVFGIIAYLLCRALYKVELSKLAFKGILGKL